MERKTYGRTEVRSSRARIKEVKHRFIAYTLVIAVIGVFLGYLIGWNCNKTEVVEVTTESGTATAGVVEVTTPNLDELVGSYGTYDSRVFESEISMDWSTGDDSDFVPLDVDLDGDTQEFIYYMCKGYNIDWTLVMALIKHESNFDETCVSPTNDYGLMQINECNHEWITNLIGVTDYLDATQNVRAGLFVLRKLFEEYQDTDMVLMVYNMGVDGASRLWEKGIYTTSYTEVIEEYQKQFQEELEGKKGIR